ncbi:hypothetical protein JCM11251_001095 [Rhodosporidiobolus azoricus]
MTVEQLIVFINGLSEGSNYKVDLSNGPLMTVRVQRWCRQRERGIPSFDPFDCLAILDFELVRHSDDEETRWGKVPWLTAFRHKALVFFTLRQLSKSSPPPASFSPSFLTFAENSLRQYIQYDLHKACGPDTVSVVTSILDTEFSDD